MTARIVIALILLIAATILRTLGRNSWRWVQKNKDEKKEIPWPREFLPSFYVALAVVCLNLAFLMFASVASEDESDLSAAVSNLAAAVGELGPDQVDGSSTGGDGFAFGSQSRSTFGPALEIPELPLLALAMVALALVLGLNRAGKMSLLQRVIAILTAGSLSLGMADTLWDNFVGARDQQVDQGVFPIGPVLQVALRHDDPSVLLLPNGVPVLSGIGPDMQLTFVIPFSEASCRVRDDGGQWTGTSPDDAMEDFLTGIGRGLVQCDEGRPPTVRVRGFSSSSEVAGFEQCGAPDSDEANRLIANRRQETVTRILEEASRPDEDDGEPNLIVEGVEWSSYEDMRDAGQYDDIVIEGYSTERGILNRRAEIILIDPAGCTPPPATDVALQP